jgi:multidrug efflux pump subunit AcrA (membrane-fusion protein)
VLYSDGGATVQVINDTNRVETRRITLGLASADKMEAVSGLKEGDLVVARAGTFLRDGDFVRPILETSTKFTEVNR